MSDLQLVLRIRANADGTAQVINSQTQAITNLSAAATNAGQQISTSAQRITAGMSSSASAAQISAASFGSAFGNMQSSAQRAASATNAALASMPVQARASMGAMTATMVSSLQSIDQQITRLTQHITSASTTTSAAMGSMAASTRNTSQAWSGLTSIIGSYLTVQSGVRLIQLADQMTLLDSRVRIATSSLHDYKAATEALQQISLETGTALASNTQLFARINKSIESAGGSIKTTLGLTQTLAQALTVSGASAGEANSVIIQLSQAFSSGVLRGDEFNSVMENGSRIVDALTVATGKTRGELRKMAEEGELTATMVINALQSQAAAIDNDFSKIPLTVGRALENIKTNFSVFIEDLNNATGMTKTLAENLDTVAKALGKLDSTMNPQNSIQGRIDMLNRQIGAKYNAIHDKFANDKAPTMAEANELLSLVRNREKLTEVLNAQQKAHEQVGETALKEVAKQTEATEKASDELKKHLQSIQEGYAKTAIIAAAQRNKIDANFMLALAEQESGSSGTFNTVSSAGARGLMQIKPKTARMLADEMGVTYKQIYSDLNTHLDAAALLVKKNMAALQKEGKLTAENLAGTYNAGVDGLRKFDFNKLAIPFSTAKNSWYQQTKPYMENVDAMVAGLNKISGTDWFKGVADGTSKAKAELEKFNNEGAKMADQFSEPIDKFVNDLTRMSSQLEAGNITNDQYQRGLSIINDQLEKNITSAMSVGSAQVNFNSGMAKAVDLYNRGKISLDTLTLALRNYKDELDKTNPSNTNTNDDWIKSINQANELADKLNNAQDNLDFAQQLQDIGYSADMIKSELNQYKVISDEIKNNPNLDPAKVGESVAKRIAAENELSSIVNDNNKKQAASLEAAYKRAIENIQDAFGQMFENVLNGSALDSFESFAENISKTLNKAISQALAQSLSTLFSKETDWSGIVTGAAAMGVSLLTSALTKKPATQSASTAATSAALGSGAMHIADSGVGGAGYAMYLEQIKRYNLQVKQAGDLALNVITTQLSKIPEVQSLLTQLSSSVGATVSSEVSSLAGKAGYVLSAIKLGYDLFTIAGQKYTTTLEKVSQGFYAAEAAAVAMLGVANPVAWVVGGVLRVLGSVTEMAAGHVVSGLSNLLGGHLGGFMASIFSPPRQPNAWLNTFNPNDALENPNRSNAPYNMADIKTIYIEGQKVQIGEDGFYRAYGNKSAVLGTLTPFGATQFSIHEIPKAGVDREAIINGFKPLLDAIRIVDSGIVNSLNEYDKLNGETGKTMAYYNAWINDAQNTFKNNQELKNTNTADMLLGRYSGIVDVLAGSGSKSGAVFNAWFDALINKFKTTDQNFETLVLNIADGIGRNIETFGKLPISLAKLLADSLKSTSQGNTVEGVLSDAQKLIGTFEFVRDGLSKLGGFTDQNGLVTWLASMNKISISAEQAGANLLTYANSLTLTGDAAVKAANDKLSQLTQSGAGSTEINAYFSTFGRFAELYKQLSITFSASDIDAATSAVAEKAKVESEAAKNVINHAIATENLGNVSRATAIQILLDSKKIEQSTVNLAEYGQAVTNATNKAFEGISYVSGLLAGTGASFDTLGIKTSDLTGVTDILIARFGDMQTAIQKTADFIKTAFGDVAYTQYSNNQAITEMQQILARNPDFKAYGLYAGMNSQNLQDANFAASKATGIPVNTLIAQLSALNVANPDLGRFVELTKQFDPQLAPQGAAYNTSADTYKQVQDAYAQSQQAAADAAQKIKDFMRPFKDSAAMQGMTDHEKELYQLTTAYHENYAKALDLKVATNELGLITQKYTNDVAELADKQHKALSNFMKTFNDDAATRGMTDYQKELYQLNKTYQSNLDQAKKLGATDAQLQVITDNTTAAIKARTDALTKERQALLDTARANYLKLGATDFENQLRDISTSFVDLLTQVASKGGSLAEGAQLIQYAFATAQNAFDKAVKAARDSYNENIKTIATTRYAVADAITQLTAPDTLSAIQQQRAIDQFNTGSFNDQIAAINTVQSLLMDRYNKEIETINKVKDAAISIGKYLDALKLNERLSLNTPKAIVDESKAQFATQLAMAQAGDATALGTITDFADKYLNSSRDYFGVSADYVAIRDQVTASLSALGVTNQTIDQRIANATANTVSQLQLLNSALDTVTQQQTDKLSTDLNTINTTLAKVGQDFMSAVYSLAAIYGVSPSQLNSAVGGSPMPVTPSPPSTGNPSPLPPGATGNIDMGRFWDLVNQGEAAGGWMAAASYAINEMHYSKDQVAGWISDWGGSYEQTMAWLSQHGFAKGGTYPGGLALVGEQGPEIINFRSPGMVYSNPQTRDLLSNPGDNKELIKAVRENAKQIADEIIRSSRANAEGQSELRNELEQLREENARLRKEVSRQALKA